MKNLYNRTSDTPNAAGLFAGGIYYKHPYPGIIIFCTGLSCCFSSRTKPADKEATFITSYIECLLSIIVLQTVSPNGAVTVSDVAVATVMATFTAVGSFFLLKKGLGKWFIQGFINS